MIVNRPAARVLCTDPDRRVLLLRWRDPTDGSMLWEPPGGGIEPGESAIDPAARELEEETGLSGRCVLDVHVPVARNCWWNGRHYVCEEEFFLGRVKQQQPRLTRDGLEPSERACLAGSAWLSEAEIGELAERLEPPSLLSILARLETVAT